MSLVPAAVTSRLALTTTTEMSWYNAVLHSPSYPRLAAGSTFLHTAAAADQPTGVAGLVLCVKELLTTEGKVIYSLYYTVGLYTV